MSAASKDTAGIERKDDFVVAFVDYLKPPTWAREVLIEMLRERRQSLSVFSSRQHRRASVAKFLGVANEQ